MNDVAPSRVPGGVDGDKFNGTRADEFSTARGPVSPRDRGESRPV